MKNSQPNNRIVYIYILFICVHTARITIIMFLLEFYEVLISSKVGSVHKRIPLLQICM